MHWRAKMIQAVKNLKHNLGIVRNSQLLAADPRRHLIDRRMFNALNEQIQEIAVAVKDTDKFYYDCLQRILQNAFIEMRDSYTGASTGTYGISVYSCGSLNLIAEHIETKNSHSSAHAKTPKIFISHAHKDKSYVEAFVAMLEKMGVKQEQLFCSSIHGYTIPLNENIYDYLHSQFVNHDIFVILMLSKNYYNSAACLNEMGVAWALKSEYQAILLPNFSFSKLDGAIDPRKVSFQIDDTNERAARLTELKNTIINKLGLQPLDEVIWERQKTDFTNAVDNIALK